MAYADNTNLALEFPSFAAFMNDGTTKVRADTVDEFCARASRFIDAKIAGKYITPIDPTASPESFSLLKDICCWMVYPRVAAIAGQQTGDSKTSTGGKGVDWGKKAADTLKEIQGGEMKLTDALLASSSDGVESYTNDNAATLQPPTFTRESEDW